MPEKANKKYKKSCFFQLQNQVRRLFIPPEGLDGLWGSGLKKKLGLDLGPG
jgi:hypothetical protein